MAVNISKIPLLCEGLTPLSYLTEQLDLLNFRPKIRLKSDFLIAGGPMKGLVGILLNGIFLCILGSQAVWAQATAQVSGTVKDSSGAVLPGVEVAATQTDTG